MTNLKEYQTVRIVKMTRSTAEYDEWGMNQRTPKIGDSGVLVDILHAPDLPDKYVVESVDKAGKPIWLSDFFADEIEPV